MNTVTLIPVSQVVLRAAQPLPGAVDLPDFLTMIGKQAGMVVGVARMVGEIVQGRESAHSVRLLELEQRCEELQRRHQTAARSLLDTSSGVEDVRGTIEILSRAAIRLFQAARGCQQLRAVPAEVSRRMLAVIQAAAESLQHGYGRLANGSPAAESDADEAIASRHVLGSYRVLALQELLAVECRDLSRPTGGVVGAPGARAGEATFWFAELYGYLNDVAQELAGAGTILKKWSQRLSGAACEWAARTDERRSALSHRCVAG